MNNILIICLFVLVVVVCLLAYKLYQFSLIILRLEESIEDCLDVLDEKYLSISKVLEKEVFFDSVEVRQVMADIIESQDAILTVANTLTKEMEEMNENKES
jgi:hypothetical protein|tara:strand:- start:683 stop:985 length:303 start_codon:yes stop_codon:yes gene_type:complete